MISEDISNRNVSFESYKQRITNFSNEFELGLFLYILRRSVVWLVLVLLTAMATALLTRGSWHRCSTLSTKKPPSWRC